MQSTESAVLFQHLTSLTEGFSQLSTRLAQVARALQDPGKPPAESLVAELVASRRDFADLCARGLALAASLAVSPHPTREALASLSDLKSVLQIAAQAEEKKAAIEDLRQRALTALDRVLTMSHRDHIAFPPLLECQAKAGALRLAVAEALWSELHPATEALAKGEDPFSDLLTFVERQGELDDDQWALLQNSVERSFSKPLAIAASRGKLTLLGVTHEDASPPPTAASEPAAAPAERATQEAVTAPEPLPIEAEERKEEEKEKEKVRLPLYQLGLDDTAQKIAAPLLNGGAVAERPAALRDLIWRLIFEDKVSLAFHVAHCLETQYPDYQPRLPPWLLRSAALGRYVRHANGEITRLLKDDFAQFSTEYCTIGHSEWDQAAGLLVVAATLQPALLAPHTRASAVLHALQLGEGLHELSAYCQLIANYGDKLQPLDPKVIKKGKDQAAWQTEVDALKQPVEGWWSRAPRLALVYAPAAKVWAKWLEPKGQVYSLLLLVRQNDFSKLAAAKKAVEQLSDDAQIKREVEHTDREVLGRRLGDDINGRSAVRIRAHLREAVGLARRWIELHESRPGQRRGSLQEQAEQLRQEVWSRQGAMLEELGALKRHNPSSILILGGLNCCRRALENIRTLFDPEASFPTEEPLPLPLLYADLLRIPSLALNDQWELEGSDREALLDGILDLVAKGR